MPHEPEGPGQARTGHEVISGNLVEAPPAEMAVPSSAAGLCSTVSDLLAWTTSLGGGRVGSPSEQARLVLAGAEAADLVPADLEVVRDAYRKRFGHLG